VFNLLVFYIESIFIKVLAKGMKIEIYN
jgi:hypothetical protein